MGRERNLILEGINKNGDTNIQAIVQEVLEKRHKQESENLIEENKMQRKLSLHESMQKLKSDHENERQKMISRHEAQLSELEGKNYSRNEFIKRKHQLELKQNEEIKQMEKKQLREIENLKNDFEQKYEIKLASDKLKLKEAHYKEYVNAIKEFSSNSSMKDNLSDKKIDKINQLKLKLEKERAEEEAKMAEEMTQIEKEEEAKMQKELIKLEQELKQETADERNRGKKSLEILNRRKLKLLQQKKDMIKSDVERAASVGASEQEQQRIIDQYEKEMADVERRMDEEKLRTKSRLEERLNKIRKERIDERKQELED